MRQQVGKVMAWGTAGVLALAATVAGGYVYNNLTYFSRDMAAVARAGVKERHIEVGGLKVNYAEGPDNGPVLFLIHGQSGDWQNYARVLPRLVNDFHVFAVDCFGPPLRGSPFRPL